MRAAGILSLTFVSLGLSQRDIGVGYGGEFGVGTEVSAYDNRDGASYSDSIDCNGARRDEFIDSTGREVGASVAITPTFGEPVVVGAGAGYRLERYLLLEDVGGVFVVKNQVKLYMDLNGREREIVIDAGRPYIYLPCY